jgi:hypothetical protein
VPRYVIQANVVDSLVTYLRDLASRSTPADSFELDRVAMELDSMKGLGQAMIADLRRMETFIDKAFKVYPNLDLDVMGVE